MRIQELGDSVYDTYKHFWNTNEHTGVGWQLIMLLHKLVKEKDELRDLNSQLKHP